MDYLATGDTAFQSADFFKFIGIALKENLERRSVCREFQLFDFYLLFDGLRRRTSSGFCVLLAAHESIPLVVVKMSLSAVGIKHGIGGGSLEELLKKW